MNKFYENLIEYSARAKASGGKTSQTTVRLDALRDAQLWMLRDLKPDQIAQLTRGIEDDATPKDGLQNKSKGKQPVSETTAHPRYWAAFVLSGDWR